MQLNNKLFFAIEGLRGKIPGLDWVMIFAAEAIIYLLALLLIFLAFSNGGIYYSMAITTFFSVLVAFVLILVVHLFIKEKRPFISFRFKPLISFYKNLSFPSMHTTVMTIFFAANFYYSTPLVIPIFLLLIWVAFARIYIGVHYPVDILGGLVIGSLSFILIILTMNFLF